MQTVEASDVIALVLIVGCLYMIGVMHSDGNLSHILTAIVSFYFGSRNVGATRKRIA